MKLGKGTGYEINRNVNILWTSVSDYIFRNEETAELDTGKGRQIHSYQLLTHTMDKINLEA